MNYTKAQLLALRFRGVNTICLTIRTRSGKLSKQIGSNASNLITVSVTLSHCTSIQNVILVDL